MLHNLKIIQDHFGKGKGHRGLSVMIRDNQKESSKSFTVHGPTQEELYDELLMHCKAMEKVGERDAKT